MGLPIEPRLSNTARRMRQRIAPSLTLPKNTTSRLYRSNTFCELPRTSGINHEELEAVAAFYDANARQVDPPRKAKLVLKRTSLPFPVNVQRSPSSNLANRIANMLGRTTPGNTSFDMRPSFHFRRQRLRREYREYFAPSRFTVYRADSSDESPTTPSTTTNEMDDEPVPSTTEDQRTAYTSSAVSIMYAEEGDPMSANEWEIGLWPGAHELGAVDMFQIYLDVLTESTVIPSCPIEALCVSDDLDSFSAVVDGINLLKELSAELHETYDKSSSYFLHPITGSRIEIITIR